MTGTITNARISIVSGQAFFEHLTGQGGSVRDRYWLPADFGSIYGKLRGGTGHPRFAMPWRDRQLSGFWKAYCGQTPVTQISAEQCLRLVMPLRLLPRPAPVVTLSHGAERIFYDVLGFPHGLVCALTVQTPPKASMTIEEWRDRTRELYLGRGYTLEIPGAAAASGLRVQEVIEALVHWHRKQFFGFVAQASSTETPFTIATVIKGRGFDSTEPIAAQPDLQRSLNAVTSWPISWELCSVPDLAGSTLPVRDRNAAAGDVLFAGRRGRVLWRPMLFCHATSAANRLHTLSCLSHNLLAASVQAEALRLFALRHAAVTQSERHAVPAILRQRVAIQIGRMWRGEQTYRSSSVRAQLEDPASLAEVNALLSQEGISGIGPAKN